MTYFVFVYVLHSVPTFWESGSHMRYDAVMAASVSSVLLVKHLVNREQYENSWYYVNCFSVLV